MSEMTQLETLRAQLAELKAEVEKKKAEVEAAENNEKPFHGFANLYASEDGLRRARDRILREKRRLLGTRKPPTSATSAPSKSRRSSPARRRWSRCRGKCVQTTTEMPAFESSDAPICTALAPYVGRRVRLTFTLVEPT